MTFFIFMYSMFIFATFFIIVHMRDNVFESPIHTIIAVLVSIVWPAMWIAGFMVALMNAGNDD